MKARIIFSFLLTIWMILIFGFSNQNAVKSEVTSDKVAATIIDTTAKIANKEINSGKRYEIITNTRFLIRKSAHFFLYFVLGILIFFTLNSFNVSRVWLFGILFCFIYAISDEVHQLFLAGRTFKIFDILLDTFASSLSIVVINYIKK